MTQPRQDSLQQATLYSVLQSQYTCTRSTNSNYKTRLRMPFWPTATDVLQITTLLCHLLPVYSLYVSCLHAAVMNSFNCHLTPGCRPYHQVQHIHLVYFFVYLYFVTWWLLSLGQEVQLCIPAHTLLRLCAALLYFNAMPFYLPCEHAVARTYVLSHFTPRVR